MVAELVVEHQQLVEHQRPTEQLLDQPPTANIIATALALATVLLLPSTPLRTTGTMDHQNPLIFVDGMSIVAKLTIAATMGHPVELTPLRLEQRMVCVVVIETTLSR